MNLKNKFKLFSVALASSMAMVMPVTASAEVGYNATVSSLYLWRGIDVSNGPTISGGIDYSDKSGLYASAWVSSGFGSSDATAAGGSNGYELDLWVGYAGEVAGIGYDISVWSIDYPQVKNQDAATETALGLSYKDFSFGYVDGENDYSYTTLGFNMDKFGITYGLSDAGAGSEYSHVDLSYAATDALSFTVSKASDDGAGVAEEMLISASYSIPIGK